MPGAAEAVSTITRSARFCAAWSTEQQLHHKGLQGPLAGVESSPNLTATDCIDQVIAARCWAARSPIACRIS
jgi:hypothetical protein